MKLTFERKLTKMKRIGKKIATLKTIRLISGIIIVLGLIGIVGYIGSIDCGNFTYNNVFMIILSIFLFIAGTMISNYADEQIEYCISYLIKNRRRHNISENGIVKQNNIA